MSVLLESAGLGMVHLVKREMEFACDVAALRAFGSDCKKAYALTLLDMAQRNPKLVPLCSGFAKSSAEQRILAVLHFRRCKGWDGICTELMFALPTGVLATQASTPVQPVAEVVREDLPCIHTRAGSQLFHFRPNLISRHGLAAFGAKDRARGGFFLRCELEQLAAKL